MEKERNYIELIGQTGSILEFAKQEDGLTSIKFTIRCEEIYKDENGKMRQEFQNHKVCAHGKTAEFIKDNMQMGQRIAIEGRLHSTANSNASGEKEDKLEVWVKDVFILSDT